ncbi:MAG: type II secretion system protein M [Proteobacteria bacterium]|nr:type II secretion system protein M [Pseudomonadota bacterium]
MPMIAAITKNMTKRERYAVFLTGAFLCLFVMVQFIVFPYMDGKETLKRQVAQKTKDLEEMLVLKSRVEALNQTTDLSRINFAGRDKDFTLFSFLDRLSGETGIKDHITYMKPSSSESKNGAYTISQVELKLKAITLKQLTEYLYGVETSRNIMFVKRLTLDKSVKPEGYVDVVMQVETYEKK